MQFTDALFLLLGFGAWNVGVYHTAVFYSKLLPDQPPHGYTALGICWPVSLPVLLWLLTRDDH